jgi:hypothetical protein
MLLNILLQGICLSELFPSTKVNILQLATYYSSACGQPTSKGLVCFTRNGFYLIDSYLGNTLQNDMDDYQ